MPLAKSRYLLSLAALYAGVAAAYLALPVMGEFSHVLIGSALLPNDPYFTAGILEWGFHSIASPARNFFDWNAGFPLSNALAVAENFLGWQIFYAPLRLMGIGVPASLNAVLLLSLVISGLSSASLALQLGASRTGAALSGFVFAFAPFHLGSLMHLQTMSVCWIPFALMFLDRCMERFSMRDATGLIASCALTALSGMYFAVFLPIMLVVYTTLAWSFRRHRFSFPSLRQIALTGVVAAVVTGPIFVPYFRFSRTHGFNRAPTNTLVSVSMSWVAPLRSPAFMKAWSHTPLAIESLWKGEAAFVGIVASILILAAIWKSKGTRATRKTVDILIAFGIISYLFALGPYFKAAWLGSSKVIYWIPMPGRLLAAIPGIRWPSRIFFFALLAEAILAGVGLTLLAENFSDKRPRRIFSAVFLVLVLAEYWPSAWLARASVRVDEPMSMSDAYPFLASENDRGGVIELPIARDHRDSGFNHLYIYGSSGHLRRIVALDASGRRIPLNDSLRDAGRALPAESARQLLAAHGVTRIVVHRFLGDSAANDLLVQRLSASLYPLVFNGRQSAVFAIPVRR